MPSEIISIGVTPTFSPSDKPPVVPFCLFCELPELHVTDSSLDPPPVRFLGTKTDSGTRNTSTSAPMRRKFTNCPTANGFLTGFFSMDCETVITLARLVNRVLGSTTPPNGRVRPYILHLKHPVPVSGHVIHPRLKRPQIQESSFPIG